MATQNRIVFVLGIFDVHLTTGIEFLIDYIFGIVKYHAY